MSTEGCPQLLTAVEVRPAVPQDLRKPVLCQALGMVDRARIQSPNPGKSVLHALPDDRHQVEGIRGTGKDVEKTQGRQKDFDVLKNVVAMVRFLPESRFFKDSVGGGTVFQAMNMIETRRNVNHTTSLLRNMKNHAIEKGRNCKTHQLTRWTGSVLRVCPGARIVIYS